MTNSRYSKSEMRYRSAIANKAFLTAIKDRANYALQPLTNPKSILVAAGDGRRLSFCSLRQVKLDLPLQGFMIAVSLLDKP